jgi:hypothetical protein
VTQASVQRPQQAHISLCMRVRQSLLALTGALATT